MTVVECVCAGGKALREEKKLGPTAISIFSGFTFSTGSPAHPSAKGGATVIETLELQHCYHCNPVDSGSPFALTASGSWGGLIICLAPLNGTRVLKWISSAWDKGRGVGQ